MSPSGHRACDGPPSGPPPRLPAARSTQVWRTCNSFPGRPFKWCRTADCSSNHIGGDLSRTIRRFQLRPGPVADYNACLTQEIAAMPVPLADLLRSARVFDLEQPRYAGMPIHPTHKPGYFYSLHRRHRDTYQPTVHGPRSGASGVLTMMEHSGTHMDALCHQACGLQLFGGLPTDEVETPFGFTQLGIESAPPLLGRGVLLDIAGWKGATMLPPKYGISADELIACATAQKVEVRKGDILLVRTGFATIWDREAEYLDAAGVSKSGTLWAAER